MVLKVLIFFSLLLGLVVGYSADSCDNVTNILTRHGYSYEIHTVTTEDFFELNLFRIIGIGSDTIENGKPVIVMQAGIFASANSFLGNSESSLAFYFTNRGYDVWLASSRGTQYSKTNTKYKPETKKYWDFTFEELGTMDTKTYLEYVYTLTGQKIIYFGASQGFMQMLAAFSLNPEFFKKVLKKIVGWGAVVRPDLSGNVIMVLTRYLKLWPLLDYFGIDHLGSADRESCLAEAKSCDFFQILCRIKAIFVEDFVPYNKNYNTMYATDVTSIKNIQHLAYNIYNEGFFRHPSKGEKMEYNLTKITEVPIGICVGEHDLLATQGNARWLKEKFKDNNNFKIIGTYKYLGHRTFLTTYNAFQHYTDTYNFINEK